MARIREGTRVEWSTGLPPRTGTAFSDECPQGPIKGVVIVAVDSPHSEKHGRALVAYQASELKIVGQPIDEDAGEEHA